MNFDSFLEIGNQHKICEDHITHGSDPCPHIILSDGCSDSKNSNYGAMILTQLAKQYLEFRKEELHDLSYDYIGNWTIYNAETISKSLGLNRNCLDATLIVSYILDNHVYVFVYGDGFIITVNILNEIEVRKITFTSNFPYYLSYEIDFARRATYKSTGYSRIIEFSLLRQGGENIIFPESKQSPFQSYRYSFGPSALNIKEFYITSDGINSFMKNGVKIPVEDVIINFLDIKKENRDKNNRGVFVQRRCRKAIRSLKEEGWSHYDDISFGGFIL